ncbi:SusC/RagA family TonB-linked outer membrane protein [Roseivirga pacifica]|uniref:SusC/RagA family TonB-linked outer membrane protein n=1 Tax=Roseivirga pacifica TaxID=1267423 RepID=UPI0020946D0C|nr:SusC/RagA family TonB-linked outer membrane protein [Roseivirga pacifica]MCO6359609.1 SusC/RagA family TonB-linked outer membrane protein [Roseivirga pacifica]MCO6366979.1 SusC/RagA family TonB-linked outer membrane protein [Roseivirga pacifica]MCO6370489.1 SusC/RagA family TonB-linked outer membrane protein [Roseivirga pacifica]MCO6374636.1 SusC/RagA family TonB-linked outer membrane protein [Roseivirga pacifica]MCO6379894.1 SusC/RagA family TonB-linked outer membrane protein [Roseivirga p
MKRVLLTTLMSVLVCVLTQAQERTISGTVTDETGLGLPGVNVLLKGTVQGVPTNADGTYRISVPGDDAVLVYRFLGYTTQEITVGSQTTINVQMQPDVTDAGEVVVTALGVTQEKASLGYGVASLDKGQLQAKTQKDVAKLLRGKATGVDITQTSGMAGSGTNVIIRGYSSITGSNQPLFVVDGVPFNSDTNNDGSFAGGGGAASSRFLDLDPQSIENVSILKGLSATVLYGEAGRNGVILITTKNGNAGADASKGFEVSVSQQVSATKVANLPDYQNVYGNGFGGDFGWFFSTWGPSFDTQGSNGIAADGTIAHPYDQPQYNDDFPEFIGQRYDYRAYEGVEDFFADPAMTYNTSLSIAKSLGKGSSISATYSYLDDGGFTPALDEMRGGGKSNYQRKSNFGLGIKTELENGLKVQGTFNYVDSEIRRPLTNPAFGGAGTGLFAAVLFTPRSIDLANLPYQSPIDGSNVYYRRGSTIENPYWNLNNKTDMENLQRFFGNIQLSYDLTDWLTATYRFSLDNYTQINERTVNKGSGSGDNDGYYNTSSRTSVWKDHVANLAFNQRFNDDWSLNGLVGFNYRETTLTSTSTNSQQQLVYGLFAHDKFVASTASSGERNVYNMGAYVTASLGYRDFLYASFQGRNDWTSTLEKDNRTIFYPSASVSFLPVEAIPALQNSNVLDFAKIRLGYGTSAGYPSPYNTRSVLNASTNVFVGPEGTVLNTNAVSNFLGNPNLKPETHKEWELGIEAQFLNNRVGIDVSLYNKTSEDLIINLPLDPSTGYTSTSTNGATVTNKGIEAALNLTPVRGEIEWNLTLNYTRNRPVVDEILVDGLTEIGIAGYSNLGNYAIEGEPYGVMRGTDFNRNDDGELIVNNQGSYTANSEIVTIGNPNPDFQTNWINTVTWKGISFGFQWSYTHGGDIYSTTVGSMMARGNTVDTGQNRFQPIILNGVKSDGTPNDIQTYMGDVFFDAYFGANSGSVFDASVVRLREVSVSYALPASLLSKTPFGSAGISISGENLFFKAPNFPEGMNFDPEVLSLGVGNGRGFDFRTAPTAKRWGMSINLTF